MTTKRLFTVKEMAEKINITYASVQYALTIHRQPPTVLVGTVKGYDNDTVKWLKNYFEDYKSLVLPFAEREGLHQSSIKSPDENVRRDYLREGVNIRMIESFTMYTSPYDYCGFVKGTSYNVLPATFDALKSANLAEKIQ